MNEIAMSDNGKEKGAPTSRRRDAYEVILRAILTGDLPPGAKLDEKSLAEDFGIGISGVRDALARLALERLVIRTARIGTTVTSLDVQELQDIFETRYVLEGLCARLAAQRGDAQDVADLESTIAVYRETTKTRDFRLLLTVDQKFHRTIARATKNKILEQQVVNLHNNASRFWYVSAPRLDQDAFAATLETHIVVAKAIAARDPEAAEKAMQASLGHVPWVGRLLNL